MKDSKFLRNGAVCGNTGSGSAALQIIGKVEETLVGINDGLVPLDICKKQHNYNWGTTADNPFFEVNANHEGDCQKFSEFNLHEIMFKTSLERRQLLQNG